MAHSEPMAKASILIVEDEPVLALELKEDLLAAGYSICATVSDGDQVLAAVIRHRPDVIIMDIRILGFRDGIEAAGRVRAVLPVPIVFLSSRPREEVSEQVANLAPAWYLEKPYNENLLLATLRAVMDE